MRGTRTFRNVVLSSTNSARRKTPYELLGSEDEVHRLVDRWFYDLIDSAPEAATIRTLHARSLKSAREKLFLYLTGWTGGPPAYVEQEMPNELRVHLRERFHELADHMRNRPDE